MLIDLSHVVEDGMITYRGLPAPVICDFLSREQSRSLYADLARKAVMPRGATATHIATVVARYNLNPN